MQQPHGVQPGGWSAAPTRTALEGEEGLNDWVFAMHSVTIPLTPGVPRP
jgi:hypothetical protein